MALHLFRERARPEPNALPAMSGEIHRAPHPLCGRYPAWKPKMLLGFGPIETVRIPRAWTIALRRRGHSPRSQRMVACHVSGTWMRRQALSKLAHCVSRT